MIACRADRRNMKSYHEPAREIPVTAETDVLVVGGGPAGFCAALSAAREGTKTMLVEQAGDLGGVSTTGLMSHWTGMTKGGMFQEIIDQTTVAYTPVDHPYYPLINHEYLKTWMLETLLNAGVRLRLYTHAVDVVMDGTRIRGIVTESKDGRQAIFSKLVMDCSGDGDIAARAGAEYVLGRETDGMMQPMTLMLQLGGVDRSRITYVTEFEKDWLLPQGSLQALAREHLSAPMGHVLIYPTVYPGCVILNMTNCTLVDGTKAEDLTKAQALCRRQIKQIVGFLKDYVPGFENAYPIKTASSIGVRETRHFIGEKIITEQDIAQARVFDDWAVANLHFNFDVHGLTGAGMDATGQQDAFDQKKGYTIPYGCFVPKKIDGMLIAGRNISGTHLAHSNYRAMPICANMGQAAGVAAAICIRQAISPRNLDVRLLQKRMRELGVSPD